MFLKIVIGILATIGALVVMAIGAVFLIYFLLVRRLHRNVKQQIERFESIVSETVDAERFREIGETISAHVPPMYITLFPIEDRKTGYDDDGLVRKIDQWMRKHEFKKVDFFEIEELNEDLCIYLNRDRKLLAAIRDLNDRDGLYVEFCFDLGNARRGGVSNPPSSTLGLPDDAVGKFFTGQLRDDFKLLDQMYAEALKLMRKHTVRVINPTEVDDFYESAHEAEIVARIESGGVSEAEIRQSFVAQGIEVDESEIALIAREWQNRVDEYLLDFADTAGEMHTDGDDILVVHDRCGKLFLKDRLKDYMVEDDEMESDQQQYLTSELVELLERFTPRDAVARFRPLLPTASRYRLVEQIQEPLPADFYLLSRG